MRGQLCVKTWMPQQCLGEPPCLCASAELPCWEGSGGRRLDRYYRAYGKAFTRYAEKILLPEAQRAAAEGSPPWEIALSTVVTLDTPRLVSLYTDTVVTAASRRRVLRRGDTWDRESGTPVTLGELLPPHTPWRRRIFDAVSAQIRQNEAAYYPDWPHRLRRSLHSRAFYVSEEGLWVYFPMYALCPRVTAFLLPWPPEGPHLLQEG